MPQQQQQQQEQVTFRDVAACFSEEEWKLLHKWQKDFYKNVMKEIHQALILLGYQIVNADTLLRICKGRDFDIPDPQDAERMDICNTVVSSHPVVNPDVLLRITQKEELCTREQQSPAERRARGRYTSRVPVVTAAEEEEPYSIDGPESKPLESDHPSSGFTFYQTEVSLGNEAKPSVSWIGHSEATDSASGSGDLPDIVLVDIKEEEISPTDHRDSDVTERIFNPTGYERTGSRKKVRDARQCARTVATSTDLLERQNTKVPQNSHRGPTSRRRLWYENYMALKRKEMTQCESGSSIHQRSVEGRQSQKRHYYANSRWNSPIPNGLCSPQQEPTSLASTDYEKIKRLTSETAEDVESEPDVRLYACTICEKAFYQMKQLLEHYRTHTGEKPHMCPICHKCFSRKDNLKGHIRIHTGERPYKCAECGRSFTWKSHLNVHRKKKHIPQHDLWG